MLDKNSNYFNHRKKEVGFAGYLKLVFLFLVFLDSNQ